MKRPRVRVATGAGGTKRSEVHVAETPAVEGEVAGAVRGAETGVTGGCDEGDAATGVIVEGTGGANGTADTGEANAGERLNREVGAGGEGEGTRLDAVVVVIAARVGV